MPRGGGARSQSQARDARALRPRHKAKRIMRGMAWLSGESREGGRAGDSNAWRFLLAEGGEFGRAMLPHPPGV